MIKKSSISLLTVAAAILSPLSFASAGPLDTKAIETPAPSSEWQFTLEPYGWMLGLDGTVGAGGIDADIYIPFHDLLSHLDWALFLKAEARKGKWGVIFDGYFAELSDVADPKGPLYTNVNVKLQQGIVQLALAYRIIDSPRGYLDIFAGARYNYLDLDLNANIDSSGIENLSNNVSDRVVDRLVRRAAEVTITDVERLKRQIEQGVETDLEKRLKAISDQVEDSNQESHPRLEKDGAILRSVGAAARAVAAQRAAMLRGETRVTELVRLERDVQNAEKNLAKTINKKIKNALPTNVGGNEQWVDPIIGLRGQYSFNEHFFATAYADIGGFSVGSILTWQLSGSVGYNFNKSVFSEIGYRYLQTNYKDGGFKYDANEGGAFVGIGFRF